jgi:mono/diheme cytochrome c family protein
MRATLDFLKAASLAWLLVATVSSSAAQPATTVTSKPVYVPNTTHANEPLPNGVIAWEGGTQRSADATNGQDFARFVFAFTNIAQEISLGQVTNRTFTTNSTIVTNTGFWSVFSGRKYTSKATVNTNISVATVTNSINPAPVTILNVHPSCGCTTAELPPVPWLLAPGTNAVIRVNVNLAGKSGIVFKSVTVTTDKGKTDLMLRINIQPAPPAKPMSEEERARGIAASKIDRQAVFKGECASCHVRNVQGQYGQQLFAAICSVCHEASPRATMVPDLHQLKDPTSEEFWRTWITSGKAGTLMPAFATAQGGPLNDMQIASLAVYLNATIPSHVPPAAAK